MGIAATMVARYFRRLDFGRTLHPVPELRYRDGRNFKQIIRPRCRPGCEVEDTPFPAD